MSKYTIIVILVLLAGCKCPQCDSEPRQKFEPFPLKLDNLLFDEPLGSIAYKSVTKKDYECEEEC
jgi:hypothetical protein